MLTLPRSGLSAFPNSPYAAELRGGFANLRFSPAMEAQYLRTHLRLSRTLIRVACVLVVMLAIVRFAEQGLASFEQRGLSLLSLALVLASALVLGAMTWTRVFERLFLPWARIIVPVRNVVVVANVAAAATHGQAEMLMLLPAMLLGPFFFMALRFRAALLSGVLTVASFAAMAAFFGMAPTLALHSSVFLIMALIACAVAAWHIEKWSRTAFLEQHLIVELAQHDALTGAKNRRVFDDHLAHLWLRGIADSRALAILLIDVDHFKAYNDRYGHQAGDEALRRVAQTVKLSVPGALDIVARYGGEEFAAVLYGVDAEQATAVADRMRCAVKELCIEHGNSRTASSVTISVGVAVIEPTAERNVRGALQLADQALYAAKARGRNRVELMKEAEHRMMVTGIFSSQGMPCV